MSPDGEIGGQFGFFDFYIVDKEYGMEYIVRKAVVFLFRFSPQYKPASIEIKIHFLDIIVLKICLDERINTRKTLFEFYRPAGQVIDQDLIPFYPATMSLDILKGLIQTDVIYLIQRHSRVFKRNILCFF